MNRLRTHLGYRYVPLPKWVAHDIVCGKLNNHEARMLLVLYRDADSRALANRKPTPRRRLETLAEQIEYPHSTASLRKMLSRLRVRGYLDYEASGNPRQGYVYVFTLKPDSPELSASGPSESASSRPSRTAVRRQTGSETSMNVPSRSSTENSNDGEEDGPALVESRPANAGFDPAANRGDAKLIADELGPSSSDVREEAKPSSKDAVRSEASLEPQGRADACTNRIGDDEVDASLALTDRISAMIDENRARRGHDRRGGTHDGRAGEHDCVGADDAVPVRIVLHPANSEAGDLLVAEGDQLVSEGLAKWISRRGERK